jgi:tetratricopeptide (TPR) repeat protein
VLEVLRKVRSEPAPTIAQRNPEVQIPIALERVIQRCLEKDRARRYPDMRELEAALCEAQIASKLVTAWDDLPLPEVAPERYAVLKRAYETATRPRASPRALWLPIAAAAALVLGFALVVFIGLNDARDTSKGAGPVQEHVELAHAAAARAFYVYPPADDPAEPTAYREVVALEGLEGELQPPAVEAAQALRQEFGETLTRLGDQYWGRDGGRIFAVDYYINALLFDPDNARARERAPITPGELLALRHKAETGEFSHAELTASAPLVALAEPDDDKRFEKLKELEQEPSLSGSRREGHIAKLIEHEAQSTPAGLKRARRPAPTPTPPVEPEPELLPLETTDVAHAAQTKPAPKNTGPSAHDRDRAMELALSGHALLQRGKRAPAEQKFNQALALNHRNHVALAGLAHIHYDRADYGRSVRYASRAVALAPSKSSYRIVRGDAYFKVYRYKEAEREYAKAKSLGHPDAGTRLAKVEAKLRD